ncbi:regulator of nucleoside diphosphate kinase [Hyphomicrobium sp. 1Nfss2.1]|uniref:nucleoside diphosphate kinase regulator n=1 Tax=Hyphomicrobium sp. 1Nfss2.1 TaxID=3413936 RepID=UPI003C7AE1FA
MLQRLHNASLPPIVVGRSDEHRLTALAIAATLTGSAGTVGHTLLFEMERADVVGDADVPDDVVRMESVVDFSIDDAKRRRVRLVYPADADIDSGKISVLTPIGTALIGMSPGQAIPLEGPDGCAHTLAVLSVAPAESRRPQKARVAAGS